MHSNGASIPIYEKLPRVGSARTSRSIWGNGDVYGALNLITEAKVVEAAALVKEGAVYSLNWSLAKPDPPLFHRQRFESEMISTPISSDDRIKDFNTQGSSQWDGFKHIRHPVHGVYGGDTSANQLGIDRWASRGIVTRGVLADVGSWRESIGRPLDMSKCDPIPFDEVVETLNSQGSDVRPGDVLLVRTGWLGWYETLEEADRESLAEMSNFACPGLAPGEESARGIWNLHVSAIAADNPALEAWPPGSQLDEGARSEWLRDPETIENSFLHMLLLPMLGIPIGEMFVLDQLAEACRKDGRYEFMFTSAPLNIPGGVASPPNALAIR